MNRHLDGMKRNLTIFFLFSTLFFMRTCFSFKLIASDRGAMGSRGMSSRSILLSGITFNKSKRRNSICKKRNQKWKWKLFVLKHSIISFLCNQLKWETKRWVEKVPLFYIEDEREVGECSAVFSIKWWMRNKFLIIYCNAFNFSYYFNLNKVRKSSYAYRFWSKLTWFFFFFFFQFFQYFFPYFWNLRDSSNNMCFIKLVYLKILNTLIEVW